MRLTGMHFPRCGPHNYCGAILAFPDTDTDTKRWEKPISFKSHVVVVVVAASFILTFPILLGPAIGLHAKLFLGKYCVRS